MGPRNKQKTASTIADMETVAESHLVKVVFG